VTDVGHFGMGDTEYRLISQEDLGPLESLIHSAYLRNRKMAPTANEP
jgi:hypothetical protein